MSRPETPPSTGVVERTDATLSTYAHDAGTRAHQRGLAQRGAVTKAENGVLVVERRDGSVQVLRKVAPSQSIRPGTVLKRRRAKGDPVAA